MEENRKENKALKTRIRNIQLAVLFFSIATIIFFVLWRQRVHLMHERAISYEILMAKYRAEKEAGEKFLHQKIHPVPTSGIDGTATLSNESILFDQLNTYFKENKPYLDQKLNLATIAADLNTTQKDINKVLKDNNIASFYAFVNEYRVNEARQLFSDSTNSNLKLEVIAEMAGFGTRQTFYSAFLQYTGVTPGYYRKNI